MSTPSIFNEIIGPVMRGCSSSHVAAALRIGRLVRDCTNSNPRTVSVTFDANQPLAHSYEGQGSSLGFVAGLLGYAPDSPLLPQAQDNARAAGLAVTFHVADVPTTHPNTYLIRAEAANGEQLALEAISLGGGAIEVTRLEGIPISLRGDSYVCLLLGKNNDLTALSSQHTSAEDLFKNIFRRDLWTEGDKAILALHKRESWTEEDGNTLKTLPGVDRLLRLAPVLPVLAGAGEAPFLTAASMLAQPGVAARSACDLALVYESAVSGFDIESLRNMMRDLARIMRKGIDAGLAGTFYEDRLLPAQAPLSAGLVDHPLFRGQACRSMAYVSALMDQKSAMGVIIAAPTAGACGVLGGTLWSAADELGRSEEAVIDALFAAGLIGVFIAAGATFAGEEGGCQVECGSGAAMAAAGLVQLMGGSSQQALDAAAMALQNMLGLVCDTVADRVEFPCMGRNISASFNALAAAGMSMSGYANCIPLDDTIASLKDISQRMPQELRCTGLAGLADTPAGRRLHALMR